MRIDSTKLMVAGGILFGVVMAIGQESRKEWVLKTSDVPDMLQFTVRRFKPGSTWTNSNTVPRSRFQGLSIDTLEHGGKAAFDYVTDAGALRCSGSFTWGRGSGDYTFVPNRQFVSELRKLGYDAPDEEQQFAMLMSNVSLDFARGVKDGGLQASTQELIDLRNHGVKLDYIRETHDAGYRNLNARDYMQLRDHGVGADYLRDLKRYGFNLSVPEVVQLRDHGVPSEFIFDLKAAGYDVTPGRITELRDHGVSSEYMRELKDYGLKPPANELVQLRDHGVTPEYLKGLKDAGYGSLQAEDIVRLRDHGVDTNFAREAKAMGYDFTPEQMTHLRDCGVDGRYLQTLRDAGMRNLTAEQIAKLKMHGVD
jgi:hypothetical protein